MSCDKSPNFGLTTLVMKKEILASESFSSGKRHYFLDFKVAVNNRNYVQFTRSEHQADGNYKRWSFVILQDEFEEFISAFSSLFRAAAYQGKGYTSIKDLQEEIKDQRAIKAMPVDARPREKMAAQGSEKLDNAELLAMLIGSGSPEESALELAGRIMQSAGNSLQNLAAMSEADLCKFKGMGMAKSSTIIAAMELALRLSASAPVKYKTVYLFSKQGLKSAF